LFVIKFTGNKRIPESVDFVKFINELNFMALPGRPGTRGNAQWELDKKANGCRP
jgi:hypothetical protein